MRRRDFLTFLGGAPAWPISALAQVSDRTRRIGLLMVYREGDPEGEECLLAFRRSLREAGWIEGKNLRLEPRWYAGDRDRANAYGRELVSMALDIIVVNHLAALTAVRQLTTSIPIVFVVLADPVGAGHVASFSRPGGNVTGFSTFDPEIAGKWLEALREVAPQVNRVGILRDPAQPGFAALWRKIEELAPSFDLRPIDVFGYDGSTIERAIETFAREPHGGLVVVPNPINMARRQSMISLAARYRLPAVYAFTLYARSGGLLSYGFNSPDLFRRSGTYVDRILNGEKPGELPVQAPTKFELAINLNTAKALGLDIPRSLLARADELIE
jgi:putative tryptophan/tyrosine transport system substrate-binding protein